MREIAVFAGMAHPALAAEICADLGAPHPKLTVLSVAPALAEAISRIHDGESVSSLFDH